MGSEIQKPIDLKLRQMASILSKNHLKFGQNVKILNGPVKYRTFGVRYLNGPVLKLLVNSNLNTRLNMSVFRKVLRIWQSFESFKN